MRHLIALILIVLALPTFAEVHLKTVDYKQGDTALEGFFAYDDAWQGPRPGVLVVHDWMGNGEFSKQRITDLAKLGYAAFAADIYGKGTRPKDPGEAAQFAGKYKSDRALLRARALAGLEELKKQKQVDGSKLAVMGYCFGGTTSLEVARSGADVKGVVSFHGGLSTPTPQDAKNIKGKVLALHGADDPFVKPDEVEAFKKEMADANVKMTFIPYAGAVHGFTNPAAGNDNSKGAAFNEKANRESWEEMKKFFGEIFK